MSHVETYVVIRTENHPDKLTEIVGVYHHEEEANAMVLFQEEEDRRDATRRGYPKAILNHYRVDGPWLVEVDLDDNSPSRRDLISSQS